jgi:hypothetical protein
MTGGAMHQAGSQGVTAQPYASTAHCLRGWDEGSIFPLIESEEIRADILPELEQRVPAIEHLDDH